MDHQFLNVDCHPSALPRPALHPSYAGSSGGGGYSLDIHQSSDSLATQFNPYRLPTSSDTSLTSSQFSAFDSFYKAYQSAYGQNSALGVMFGHPSYRFDGPLLPHDQQLMLPGGFLQYPPLFPNSSLYATLPGSSTNPRYPADYFGQNISGLSSFSNSSKFGSGPDLSSTQSWLGLDRPMPSNLLNAFTAPPVSSESTKEDRHGGDSSVKKIGDGDHYENRSAFANHLAHQPCTSSQVKFNRQVEDSSSHNSLRHHFSTSSLQPSLVDPFNHREGSQRRGNGEAFPSKRQEYPYANERSDDKKSEFMGHGSGKESSFQKRGVLTSPLCKSTSFPVMTTFPEVSCVGDIHPPGAGSFARHNSEYLFNHYASKMYPPNSFSSELLNLQSKTAPSSTFYHHHHQQNALQRSNDKMRHETPVKTVKSEDKNSSKNCLPLPTGSKPLPHVEKSFEQKFHRPFELVSGKPAMENVRGNSSTPQKAKKSGGKNSLADERNVNSLKNAHQQNSHISSRSSTNDHVFHNLNSDGNVSANESLANPANKAKSSHDSSYNVKDTKVRDETPLNLAFGDGTTEKTMKSPPLVSKLDLEEAWRSTFKNFRIQKDVGGQQINSKTQEMKYEDLYDDYDYEYDKKVARLTTVISVPPLHPSDNSQEKIDFLSSLGLSTKEKCKELEYEKHRRRKRQLRERSVSPTILKDDEEHIAESGFTCCTSDCPHKNGLDKEAMLAMLGLHQIEICSERGKYYEAVDLCAMTTDSPSVLPSFTSPSSYSHSFSYSPSSPSTSFYSFPTQYPTTHLPTAPYTFYPPGYLIDQPSSSALSSSSSSSCTPATQLPLASPYCNFYDNHHHHHHHQVSESKTSPTYSYHSNFTNCFEGQQQLYYNTQGKNAKDVPASSSSSSSGHDGSNYVGYNINSNFEHQNLLDTSANMSAIMMERCISSTPACRNPRGGTGGPSPLENGLPKVNEPSLFHWPGVDSVIESYHRYIEERAMEKQLLHEHTTKLGNSNADMLNAYEQWKNKISNLRKVQLRLNDERDSTQSQLDVLKNFMMQLK